MAPNSFPRILVVEDDAIIGMHLRASLKSLAYEVLAVVDTGEAAVDLVPELLPDLILMDIELAGRLTGIEAASRIHESYDVPIVYLTAYADSAILHQAKETDPFGYLIKPFDAHTLRATLEMAQYKHQLARQLRDSEARYRSVMEQAVEGIALFDPDARRIVEANTALQRLLGYSAEELGEMTPYDLLVLDAEAKEALRQRLHGERRFRVDTLLCRRRDGTALAAELSATIVSFGGRELVSVVVHDVSARQRAEAELQARERFLGLLNQITHAALEAADLEDSLRILASRMGELLAADRCYITLWDEARQRVVPTAAAGAQHEAYRAVVPKPGETTLTESVLAAGRAIAVPNVFDSPYMSRTIAEQFRTCSVLGLPLIADGQKLGAILVAYDEPHQFTADEVARGEQAAGTVALMLAKMQLLEGQRQMMTRLVRANTLLTALARVAARVVSARDPDGVMQTLGTELKRLGLHCLIALHSADAAALAIRYLSLDMRVVTAIASELGIRKSDFHIPAQRFPYYGELVEQGQSRFVADPAAVLRGLLYDAPQPVLERIQHLVEIAPDTHSVCVPLRTEDHVSGVLLLWGRDLHETDLPAASIFGNQVAMALENARLYAEVQQLAITDALTEVYNWRGLLELGRRELERALRYNRPLAGVMLDIDHFKRINDRFGHAIGNQVLRALAARCQASTRAIDLVARYGGEEFVLLLPENDPPVAIQVAERLRQVVADTPIDTDAGPVSITISLGIAMAGPTTPDLANLLQQADIALYAAKQGGRNQVILAAEAQPASGADEAAGERR